MSGKYDGFITLSETAEHPAGRDLPWIAWLSGTEGLQNYYSLHWNMEKPAAPADAPRAVGHLNKVTAGSDKAGAAMAAFDRMEEKADQMLNQANAMEELNKEPVDKAKKLEDKYKEAGKTSSVDAELAKMKEELGL